MSITVAVCTSAHPAYPYNTSSTASGHRWLVRKHRSGKFMMNSWETAFLKRVTGFRQVFSGWNQLPRILFYTVCDKWRHTMNLRLNYSHILPTMKSSGSDSSRLSLAGEESNLLYLFWGHFKDLTSTVGADGNCLGQRLQTNFKESTGKVFHCVKGKFGNQPFQAIWWRMESQKGPHSPI